MDGARQPGAEHGKALNAMRAFLFCTVLLATAPAAVGAAATLPQHSTDKSLGVGSCASSLCHGAVEPWKKSNVLQNEYITWSRWDKHARAYTVLLNERSKEIARRLELPQPAHQSALCLDCHAHNVRESKRGSRFVLSDGVMCEACHGASERWIKSHVERGATRKDNLARGLYPTADHVERARLCLSCHFGNAQKFVTHKMMAAGHPRMSFELDTFTQIQPPHYRQQAGEVWEGVRIWAIGQALAAYELLEMLNDPKRGRDGFFPELVLFDCHSCHHPMKDKRNAGARLGLGPGFVRLNDSNLLMLRQIARRLVVDQGTQLTQQVQRFHKAVAAGTDTLAQARSLQQTISQLLPTIGSHRFSADDLNAILLGLIEDGLAGQYSDYQGAEQAVMGIQSVADFMRKQGRLKTPAMSQAMKRLLAAVARDEQYDVAAFQQALRELKTGVESISRAESK
jgi:hypothetical protein